MEMERREGRCTMGKQSSIMPPMKKEGRGKGKAHSVRRELFLGSRSRRSGKQGRHERNNGGYEGGRTER